MPFIEKIFLLINKIPSFSTLSSLLLQDYLSGKENFHVKKEVRLFKTSPSLEFPPHLSIETGETFAINKFDSSKKSTSVKKVHSINYFLGQS